MCLPLRSMAYTLPPAAVTCHW
uniref:Uncharacterized protein n=1 Tax=Anguilla anguilla TaxID=7936 RepID=A0A0E9TZZ3_ANGAN